MIGDQRDLARLLQSDLGLSEREIAKATGAGTTVSVRRWRLHGAKAEPRSTEPLDDLRAIVGLMLNSGSILKRLRDFFDRATPTSVIDDPSACSRKEVLSVFAMRPRCFSTVF